MIQATQITQAFQTSQTCQASFSTVQSNAVLFMANAIAVAEGNGSVGNNLLSLMLSFSLATHKQRVLLFAGDLDIAKVRIQLGHFSKQDRDGILPGQYGFAETVIHFGDYSLDVITGQPGSSALASLAPYKLRGLADNLAQLAAFYDKLVIDLGAGIDKTVLHLAQRTAVQLVVATDEPTALTNAYALIKVSLQRDPESDLRIVIDKANSVSDGQRTYALLNRACENFLKFSPPLAGIIRRDVGVREPNHHQTPLPACYRKCAAEQDVDRLVESLLVTR